MESRILDWRFRINLGDIVGLATNIGLVKARPQNFGQYWGVEPSADGRNFVFTPISAVSNGHCQHDLCSFRTPNLWLKSILDVSGSLNCVWGDDWAGLVSGETVLSQQ